MLAADHAPTASWRRPSTRRKPLRREFAELHRKGYQLVGEVAKTLGVPQTTLRRMEGEGVRPKSEAPRVARGRSVRACATKEVERIARSKLREAVADEASGRWRRSSG